MAVIKADVPKEFKDRVAQATEKKGISEADLVRKAVKNYLDSENKTYLSPLQRAGLR